MLGRNVLNPEPKTQTKNLNLDLIPKPYPWTYSLHLKSVFFCSSGYRSASGLSHLKTYLLPVIW